MREQSLVVKSLKLILWDLLGDFIKFPIWWYSRGAIRALKFCFNELRTAEKTLALGIWVKNLFVPMFGQYDWQGRLISFFIRLVQIVFRSIFLLIYLILLLILFIIWLALPVFIVYQIIYVAGVNISL